MGTVRTASCSCGKVSISLEGEPVRISVCHCLACQRRTGSVFGTQARFPLSAVQRIDGAPRTYRRIADSGTALDFHFCPDCGSTVWYEVADQPDLVAVPVGAFADPEFPGPRVSVYESRRHGWVRDPDGPGVTHHD
ncbi:MAG: GFA family protein [Hyphomicrobiaceae bacterium]